jgi:hypothetical protein
MSEALDPMDILEDNARLRAELARVRLSVDTVLRTERHRHETEQRRMRRRARAYQREAAGMAVAMRVSDEARRLA